MAEQKDRQKIDGAGAGSARGGGYASPSIIERRRRILSTARMLIGQQPLADISMDEIASRSQVAKRTLYNIFKSRELLLAAAIQQYFEEYGSKIQYRTEPASPERLVEHLAIVIRRNLVLRDYTRTLLSMFFSVGVETDVRDAIFEIAAHSLRPWIDRLHRADQLHEWIDPGILVDDLVRYRYAVGLDWARGRIESEDFARIAIVGVLTMIAGATKPPARLQIEAVLADWERFVPKD